MVDVLVEDEPESALVALVPDVFSDFFSDFSVDFSSVGLFSPASDDDADRLSLR